jgi:hypothetical protein
MSGTYPGLGGCPHCGLQVLFALHASGELVALDEKAAGPVVVRWDVTGTPRVRPVPSWHRPKKGERRCGLHNEACIGLAPVVSIGRAPSVRRRAARPAASSRRTAHAR